jgi:futalosine hydrolase
MPPQSSGAPTLLLFPTELERRRFHDQGGLPVGLALESVCGFGPVAAAARTAQLCATLRPRRVLLCGIAGTFDEARRPIGSAATFRRVALEGVGAGQGAAHHGPPALGFPQWPGSPETTDAVEQLLELEPSPSDAPLLLTTCAASADADEARLRRERFPDAAAEDMEGFGVALACALARTRLVVVRGFSNRVGERDSRSWRIPLALAAARELVLGCLEAAP